MHSVSDHLLLWPDRDNNNNCLHMYQHIYYMTGRGAGKQTHPDKRCQHFLQLLYYYTIYYKVMLQLAVVVHKLNTQVKLQVLASSWSTKCII